MQILIAPNSFKECADSPKVAQIIKYSIEKNLPAEKRNLVKLFSRPISDGGDGFLNVCKDVFDLEIRNFTITSPTLEKTIQVEVGYSKIMKTFFVETAAVLGLKVVPADKRFPLELSSVGLGELLIQIDNAIKKDKLEIDKCVIGVGGTATNDLGLGVAEVFGLNLLDDKRKQIKVIPNNFEKAKRIILPDNKLKFSVELITDVNNPLMGEKGATKTYGRQKGLSDIQISKAEKGFESIINHLKIDSEKLQSLSGAGGGLAAGLQLLFNAKVKPAEDFIKNDLGINSKSKKIDLVITGEGKFDKQSFSQKGPAVIMNEFKNSNIAFICGNSEISKSENERVKYYQLMDYFDSKDESISRFKEGIEIICKKIIKDFIN